MPIERGLQYLRQMQRVTLKNLPMPLEKTDKWKKEHPDESKIKAVMSRKGPISRDALPPYGIDPIQAEGRLPWILTVPKEPYYEGVECVLIASGASRPSVSPPFREARQYLPISLRTLQRLIDLRRINPEKPIDLPVLCNTKLFSIQPDQRQFGLQLTDEGADLFSTPINLEIQWVASELAIAAVERCGGVLTTRYFDPVSLSALVDARKFFERGEPIPRCDTPPINAVEYYTDAKQRGYLANPDVVREERQRLAQKYGYKLPDSSKFSSLFRLRKDPRQIFYGLEPGWLVNLKDQAVLKPTDAKFQAFYQS